MNTTKDSQPRRHGPDHRKNLWDRIWKDRRGKVVVYQHPNALIIGWAVLSFISLFVPSGVVENSFWWLSSAALVAWALLEIFQGVNYFRRAFGLLVLAAAVASFFSVGL